MGIRKRFERNKGWLTCSARNLINKRQQLQKRFRMLFDQSMRCARTLKRQINQLTHKLAKKKEKYFKHFDENISERIDEAAVGDSK